MDRRCPSCRASVAEDAASCSACGQRLALREDSPPEETLPARATLGARPAPESPPLTAGDLAKPILCAGLGAGVLVSLPGLSLLNCCLCFFPVGAVVGPALGWVVRSRGRPISMRAFAMAALCAGLWAGVVAALGAFGMATLAPSEEIARMRQTFLQLPMHEDVRARLLETGWSEFVLLSLLVNLPLYATGGAFTGVLGAYATARMMIADLVREDA